MKNLLIVLFLVVFYTGSNAQNLTSFSQNHGRYLKQLNAFLEKNKKKEGKELYEKFELTWNAPDKITNAEKEKIISVSNKLLKKRCKAFPHFSLYINTIIAFTESNQSTESYTAWSEFLYEYIDTRKTTIRGLELFLKGTYTLVKDNNIYKSTSTIWHTNSSDFEYIFDKKIKVEFSSMDLVCFAKRDSISIYDTKGTYFPVSNKWVGERGKVSWERSGFHSDSVFAQLNSYEIDMKKSSYESDSIQFTNLHYFPQPLAGTIQDKVLAKNRTNTKSYPRFQSYSKRFILKDIYKNVDYEGGFSMKGAKFLGSGDEKDNASINIFRNDTLFFTASSKLFIFNKENIVSNNTSITLRLDTDSIYHPGLIFKYLIKKRNVLLIRDGKGMTRASFYNTYHDVDMDIAELSWNIDDPKIDLSVNKGTTNQIGEFKSINFYSQSDYLNLQRYDDENPLVVIKMFTKYNYSEEFTIKEFSNFLKASIQQTKQYVMNLAFEGYIDYNFDTEEIKVKKKLYNYLNASVGKIDYDVIKFESNTGSEANASLNLLNFELKINGVHQIHLSDSQNVVIYPRGERILLKRNRDFEFDGKVLAGNFLFKGTYFEFSYDNFKIDMPHIEELKIQVESGKLDNYGRPIMVTVKSSVENVKGELIIDDSMNKSGNKSIAKYPIFRSFKNSFVYYDKNNEQGKVYSRDKFYFQIYPYEIDSLDNFSTNSLGFDGYFVSAGIFPPFEEKLGIMPDYSLGFKRNSPPTGYNVYGGKGKFRNEIKLSNRGLRGNGDINYITSTTKSDDFIFFPDSMNAQANEFTVKKQIKGVEFPSVEGKNIYVHWEPYEDQLFASNEKAPMDMFDNQAIINGTLQLEPVGLGGSGKMDFAGSELFSNQFKFKEHEIDADTSSFNLKEIETEGLAFSTKDVKAHVDFNERKAEFKSNGEASFIELPSNQYICFMDQFTWYMDKAEIEMSASKEAIDIQNQGDEFSPIEQEDIEIEGSRFISIHPKQDSLNFIAPSAVFSLHKHLVYANDVKFIKVADAVIYPIDGKVVIEKKAIMQPLVNTKIIANVTTRYHTIYNATTNIYGRKDYSSSGDYDYIDETKRKQVIHFDVISVDSTFQTYGTGKIGIADGFTLSPSYAYTGKFKLQAKNEFLSFDGSTKISHECTTLPRHWINFKAEIDPEEIYIPINDENKDINNIDLYNGFLITNDSSHIYGTFFNKHKKYSDTQILGATGYLFYDNSDKKYKISSKEKLNEFNLVGNYLSINKKFCNIYGEGKLNLGIDFGQFKLKASGNINENLNDTSVWLNTIIALDFFFAEKAIEVMAKDFFDASGLESVDIDDGIFAKGLADFVGIEESEKIMTEYALQGQLKKIPKNFLHTMFLSDVKFNWNTKTKSFISDGPIGIGNVNKIQINRYVDGIINITKKRGGSKIDMLLVIDDNNWYYFSYTRGVLRAYSTNEEFNANIKIIKPEDRKQKVDKGQPLYSYYPTTEKVAKRFIKKYFLKDKENNEEDGIEDTD